MPLLDRSLTHKCPACDDDGEGCDICGTPWPRGTLAPGEPHPASTSALAYIAGLGWNKRAMYLEALSSCAIEGNRTAEVCAATLRRLERNEPVSDRYLLGLAWELKRMEEAS